jgi:hypothetical protein
MVDHWLTDWALVDDLLPPTACSWGAWDSPALQDAPSVPDISWLAPLRVRARRGPRPTCVWFYRMCGGSSTS